jgi:hypothetical protein
MGPAKTPSPQSPRPSTQPPPAPGQQPVAQPPTLHIVTSDTETPLKKLTDRSPPCMGVENRDPAHKIVLNKNIHGELGPTHFHLSSTRRGWRPLLLCGHSRERLAGAGAVDFAPNGGLLEPGVADFALPRAILT